MADQTEASVSLGLYNRDLYVFLPIHGTSSVPFALPFTLSSELARPELSRIPLTFQTVISNGEFLSSTGSVAINVLFHFYVFEKLRRGEEHKSFCPAAVFTFDGSYASFSVKNKRNREFLWLNPPSILHPDCVTEVYMHPRDEDMCCSPDNAKVMVSQEVPVAVFYTVCLVPYEGMLVRGSVTRHVVVMDWEARMSWEVMGIVGSEEREERLWTRLVEALPNTEESLTLLSSILRSDPTQGAALSQCLLFYLTWQVSGCPNEPDFGSKHYLTHSRDSSDLSSFWLTRLVETCVLDLTKYLRYL